MSTKQSLADSVRLSIEMGPHVARSGFYGCANESQGVTICFMAFQAGLPIEHYMREYHIVAKTRLEMRSDAMLKNFRERGGDWTVLRRDSEIAEAEFSYLGKKQKFAATWAEIKQEPYVTDKDGKVREKYATPRSRMQMLWARLTSDSLRVIAPEIVAGYYAPEDFGDVDGDAAEELEEVAPRAAASQPVGTTPTPAAVTQPAIEPTETVATASEEKPPREPVDAETVAAIRKEIGVLQASNLPQCGVLIRNRLAQFSMQSSTDLSMADAKALLESLQSDIPLTGWLNRELEPPGN